MTRLFSCPQCSAELSMTDLVTALLDEAPKCPFCDSPLPPEARQQAALSDMPQLGRLAEETEPRRPFFADIDGDEAVTVDLDAADAPTPGDTVDLPASWLDLDQQRAADQMDDKDSEAETTRGADPNAC